MKASVIIATYKRPAYLEKCLESILNQEKPPEQLIVVTRENDLNSISVINKFIKKQDTRSLINHILVSTPGIVAAENQGLQAATGDIVCFIDDDAIAPKNWIKDTVKHYELDNKIGGVGGPVISCVDGKPLIEYTKIFAMMTWYGKRITNSTKIPENIQEVDFLRGANMSFRRSLVEAFDENLLPYWRRFEDDICLSIKEKGYKILCDPNMRVFHYETPDHKKLSIDTTRETIIGLHHNSILVKLKHSKGFKKIVCVLYEFMWGDITTPGFFQFLAYSIKLRNRWKLYECFFAMIGKIKGGWKYMRTHNKILLQFAERWNTIQKIIGKKD